jgi:hypothetical protein
MLPQPVPFTFVGYIMTLLFAKLHCVEWNDDRCFMNYIKHYAEAVMA